MKVMGHVSSQRQVYVTLQSSWASCTHTRHAFIYHAGNPGPVFEDPNPKELVTLPSPQTRSILSEGNFCLLPVVSSTGINRIESLRSRFFFFLRCFLPSFFFLQQSRRVCQIWSDQRMLLAQEGFKFNVLALGALQSGFLRSSVFCKPRNGERRRWLVVDNNALSETVHGMTWHISCVQIQLGVQLHMQYLERHFWEETYQVIQ